MKKRLRRVLFVLAAVTMLLSAGFRLAGWLSRPALPEEDTAYFFDVGEADAALIVSGGAAVLVDTGTAETAPALVREIKSLGVRELYAVVVTHPHADHAGGASKVLRAFPVRHFYAGAELRSREIDARLKKRKLTAVQPQDGEVLVLPNGATLTFLGPADDVPADNLNNRSLITLFRGGGASILLMGDAEKAAEQSLLRHHPGLQCDILKVGHHGADTSSSPAFLSSLGAETAVISCGMDNGYGHPSAETLENLNNAGIHDIHVTAESGTVVLTSREHKENAA